MTPARPPAAPRFLPDAEFLRLKALLIRRTGHFYYDDKDDLLWERVRRRLRALGLPGTGAYLDRLADPALGEAEWTALEAEITIGETFFFRYAEQFAALRQTILPELLQRNRATRRLRIWSAGCANGSEPYSLAILLHELLGDALPDWRITILGTDLNEASLAAARDAVFSPWSLRGLPAELRERDFTADGRGWRLRPRHRAMVRFQRHNLLDLLEPGAALEMNEFDLVLCRNVLIYFHPETVPRMVHALAERLVPGGWLLLGHAEPQPGFARFLRPVSLPGTAAWQREAEDLPPLPGPAWPDAPGPIVPKPDMSAPDAPGLDAWDSYVPEPDAARPAWLAASMPAVPDAMAALPSTSAPHPRRPLPRPHTRPPVSPPQGPPPGLPPADGSVLDAVRRRADLGDLIGASLACREALARDPANALLNFYDAVLAHAQGRAAEAEQAFRRTLALRDDFAMAHYQLGLLLLREGRRLPGRKAIAAAARIVHALPDHAPLEEGDGMTAGELREAARLQLELR
jgi:chemotaxis protein methyltransferase CheR